MTDRAKTAIVTGASQGIGAGLVQGFLKRGFNVVANSRHITQEAPFPASDKLALVSGDIGDPKTAANIRDLAVSRFGGIDALVNNAGIYFSKPFTDYTIEDLGLLVSVNIEGFFFVTQAVIKQMISQTTGGSIVNITAASADHPVAGENSTLPMITKGGLNAVTRCLALDYVKQGIRVNAVAPGVVDTPMHKGESLELLRTMQPTGRLTSVKDIVDAALYLTEASQVTGEVLHVDGGAHAGKW
jgi:NAD(P)-dependent dehydrogenase (short-subunit alcohol dehydrogenase family)